MENYSAIDSLTEYLESTPEERLTGEPMLRMLRAFRTSETALQSGDAANAGHSVNETHRELLRKAGADLTERDELAVAAVTFDQLVSTVGKFVKTPMDIQLFTIALMYGIAAAWQFLDTEVKA